MTKKRPSYHNIEGVVALMLIVISLVVGIMLIYIMEPVKPHADLTINSRDLNGENVLEFNYTSGILITLTGEGKMEIGDPPIAIVDLETGAVYLRGDPNEAARKFWEAVEAMKP